jgi:hypothetical protein
MSLHDVIQSDASLVFANASDFGETATYKPKLYSEGDARPNRSIVVVIDRQAFEVVSEDQQTATPVWEIQVVNSSTLGISSDELDLGGDVLNFPPRVGEAATDRTITKLLGHDEGMLILRCE